MDKLSLLDKFKDPEIMHSLSLGDKMLASLHVMILGMAFYLYLEKISVFWMCIGLQVKDQSRGLYDRLCF